MAAMLKFCLQTVNLKMLLIYFKLDKVKGQNTVLF